MRERILQQADSLLSSQLALAKGTAFLMRCDPIKGPKGQTIGRKKPVVVTSETEIKDYIDSLNGDTELDPEEYYFIHTDKPDNKALVAIWDRTFGKSTEHIEHTGKDGEALRPTVVFIPKPYDSSE